MIAKLKGLVDSIGGNEVVIDCGGVGYLVFCPARTLEQLSAPGSPATLLIETHIREDHIHLYGFSDSQERDWFRLLQTVQGVGAKVAIGILSVLGPNQLAQAVAAQDKAAVSQAPGVGPKLAARMVLELRDKVPALIEVFAADGKSGRDAAPVEAGATEDAVSALVNLGYRRVDAYGAVATAARDAGSDVEVEALIRIGLKELAQ